MKRFVISVLVGDRTGVLRDITGAVADNGGNIDGISQTVVADYFTVILTATFDAVEMTPDRLRTEIIVRFKPDEASIVVRRYEPSRPTLSGVPTDAYVVTIHGTDRPGILKQVTTCLSTKNINVEDWYVEFAGKQVTHIGEITVPSQLDIQQVQGELRSLLAQGDLKCSLQHANIFRVTSEVDPVRSILAEHRHVGQN